MCMYVSDIMTSFAKKVLKRINKKYVNYMHNNKEIKINIQILRVSCKPSFSCKLLILQPLKISFR